ncbi:ATP-dependent RNA helicase SUPV3L1, mitochondrial [Pyxicephalus adspersus]|uniref:ATP-dependent RNA helicase SUPV3L1, mitochondrial n=1 Tax=Pyxicephalus adspersus TaxID=30357 RepID=UPI003B5B86A4
MFMQRLPFLARNCLQPAARSPHLREVVCSSVSGCSRIWSACRTNSNGNNKPLDTSLFIPVNIRPTDIPESDIGAELTQPLNKSDVLKFLNKFYRRKEIQKLASENGLDARLFHQAFISFRRFVMETDPLHVDLHIVLNDICCGVGHVDDIFPFFMKHAKQIFPMLDCMDDLRKISDLRLPPNWYPEARAIQRKIVFHSGPTNSGKTYHAIQRYLSAKTGIYCGPLKLLAHEIYKKTNEAGVPCDLITGEELIHVDPEGRPASHAACTIEMCSVNTPYEVAVIDEIQMIRDPGRGWAWTRALLGLCAQEIHICGEAAAIKLVTQLMYTTGEEVEFWSIKRIIFNSLVKPTVNEKGEKEMDTISTSQALQIGGRAGRFSSIFKDGEVTTMQQNDLPLLKDILSKSVPDIQTAGLHPTAEQMEMFAYHLPDATLSNLIDIFVSLSQVDGLYFVCNIDDFKFVADMIQHIPLNLRVRYVFCTAPINRNLPFVCTSLLKVSCPIFSSCNIVLFFSLSSYRFVDMFPQARLVRSIQKELDTIIQNGVYNITKLIRASEAVPILPVVEGAGFPPETPANESSRTGQRRERVGRRTAMNLDTQSESLTSKLVKDGLLTPSMLKQLEQEWMNRRGNFHRGTSHDMDNFKKTKKK